jgi:hypothetical protein
LLADFFGVSTLRESSRRGGNRRKRCEEHKRPVRGFEVHDTSISFEEQ